MNKWGPELRRPPLRNKTRRLPRSFEIFGVKFRPMGYLAGGDPTYPRKFRDQWIVRWTPNSHLKPYTIKFKELKETHVKVTRRASK